VRRRVLIGVGVAVPVLAAGLFLALRDSTPPAEPEAAGAAVLVAPSPAVPKNYPTFGEYIPPRPAKPPRTSAPKPRTTPSRKPTRPPQSRQPCPQGWADIPMLRRWCERNGYSVR
jgi:hypothetical protein